MSNIYNLSKYYNFRVDPTSKGIQVSEQNGYKVYKYDKRFISRSNVDTLGLFRSVIVYNNHVVCFAPPKSQHLYDFMEENADLTNCQVSEYEDGTMINVFWDGDKWQMATRSKVGGMNSFFKGKMTYREMFEELIGMTVELFGEQNLVKGNSYSFVLKHPSNGLFTNEKSLTHTHTFTINDKMVSMGQEMMSNTEVFKRSVTVEYQPERLTIPMTVSIRENTDLEHDWNTIRKECYYRNVISSQGLVVRNLLSGKTTKVRYTSSQYMSLLRGNHGVLLYRFCENIKEYVRFCMIYNNNDEFRAELDIYEHAYEDLLRITYDTYSSKHIYKEDTEVPKYLYAHIYTLHGLYLQSREKITKEKIKSHYESIPTYQLMRTIKCLI